GRLDQLVQQCAAQAEARAARRQSFRHAQGSLAAAALALAAFAFAALALGLGGLVVALGLHVGVVLVHLGLGDEAVAVEVVRGELLLHALVRGIELGARQAAVLVGVHPGHAAAAFVRGLLLAAALAFTAFAFTALAFGRLGVGGRVGGLRLLHVAVRHRLHREQRAGGDGGTDRQGEGFVVGLRHRGSGRVRA